MTTSKIDIYCAKNILNLQKETEPMCMEVVQAFENLTTQKFETLIDDFQRFAPSVIELYRQTPDESWQRLLKSPNFLNRIYHNNYYSLEDTSIFFQRAFNAEMARLSGSFDHNLYGSYLWTVDGGFMISHQKDKLYHFFESPSLANSSINTDFFSIYNQIMSNSNEHYSSDMTITQYDFEKATEILEDLRLTFENLPNTTKVFIDKFIYTLLLTKISNRDNLFTSGTEAGYIGRVTISNIHTVAPEVVADALVHEATHGLLFMIDELHPWQPKLKESNSIGRIIRSPWSGNMLTLRNLLQATYVWFTLFNFWNIANENFDDKYREERLLYIQKGFSKLNISEYENYVEPGVIQEIETLSKIVF